MVYKEKMKERAIQLLEEDLQEKNNTIEKLTSENAVLASANHKINKKLSALELCVQRLAHHSALLGTDAETAAEYADVLEQIKTMSKEYTNEIIQKIPRKKKLPLTNITSIDNLFEYMLVEATKSNIDFNLKINGSINYMIEKVIPKGKLETMIGDHIQDAIIAVNSSPNVHRSILVLLGVMDGCYEFCVHDSGIEFEINTFLTLGLKAVTTHPDIGGCGIGFMTTFETMSEYGASLIIEEKVPSATDFSKSVTIRFDGKNQYTVKSYRADEIRSLCNDDSRIIIIDSYI